MQPSITSDTFAFSLSSADRARLENIALFFGIEFHQVDESNCILRAADEVGGVELKLPAETAHRRLLAEVSSRAAKWVHFHRGSSCRDSLLALSDGRLQRIAVLYILDRDTP